MAGMRDIKRRIRSVKNTQQITKAMKMVSAAKLRKAQERVVAARPFKSKLEEVLKRLVAVSGEIDHPLIQVREPQKAAYVVVTADKGLCGGYNSNLIKLAHKQVEQSEIPAEVVAVGRKGRDFFRRKEKRIGHEFINIGEEINIELARQVTRAVTNMYESGEYDQIYLVYTEFMTAIQQQPVVKKLLPIDPPEDEGEDAGDYIFEPSAEEVLNTLLPRYVENVVYQALLEAKASEHGARMTAMGSATDNAAEMIEKLTLSYNRARQAAITREISEIVGGAEALKQ
ncbi:F-type H+-transporting ATPase subunit gamma [Desulfitispora alkaliphila]|uniref:ATP synthase F1 subunit gamma n=1 Tax=Desulfitispora alkaliphila TaxID=622674 RepID=UPI003D1B7B33